MILLKKRDSLIQHKRPEYHKNGTWSVLRKHVVQWISGIVLIETDFKSEAV